MRWKGVSSLFAAIAKSGLPPQSTTVGRHTIKRTGPKIPRVVSSQNPQGSAKRPFKAVPPRPTTAVHSPAKRTCSKPLKPQPKASPPTAIDRYFARFPEFPYEPARPAANQFALLRRAKKFWKSDKNGLSEQDKRERRQFNKAFSKEFAEKFGYLEVNGRRHQKQKWMYLAQVLEFDPIPKTVEKFKEANDTIWVNIFDVLQAEKTGETVKRFAGLEELKEYSWDGQKIFPLNEAKGGALELLLKKLSSLG